MKLFTQTRKPKFSSEPRFAFEFTTNLNTIRNHYQIKFHKSNNLLKLQKMKKLFIVCAFLLAAVSSSFAYNNSCYVETRVDGSPASQGTSTLYKSADIFANTNLTFFCFWMPYSGSGSGYCTFTDSGRGIIDHWTYNGTSQDPSGGGTYTHSVSYSGYFNSVSIEYHYSLVSGMGAAGFNW